LPVALVRTGGFALISVGVARGARKLNRAMIAPFGWHSAYRSDTEAINSIGNGIAARVGE
jgi:hypothetical protein